MADAVIVSAARTPVGTFGGAFVDVSATQLGALAVREALQRAGIDEADEVLLGNVLQAGLGQNTARQSAIGAGLADTVPSTTINKVCGSGLKTVALAAQAIRAGDAECVVAGGMENMSRAPYLVENGRYGYRLGHGQLIDEMIRDGLWCAFEDCHMGSTAENIAKDYEVSREDQDAFAAASQQKAEAAITSGRFKDEIVAVPVQRRKEQVLVDTDEHPRAGTTAETLAALRAAFVQDGTVTAGKASGTRILVTLLHEMAKRDSQIGVASLCIGGGQGIAMVLERA